MRRRAKRLKVGDKVYVVGGMNYEATYVGYNAMADAVILRPDWADKIWKPEVAIQVPKHRVFRTKVWR